MTRMLLFSRFASALSCAASCSRARPALTAGATGLLTAMALLTLSACGAADGASPTPISLKAAGGGTPTAVSPVTSTVIYAPTVVPPAVTDTLEGSALTATPAPTSLPQGAMQATIAARATTTPFPTAGPPEIQTGTPASMKNARGALLMEVRLPGDSYLAGEGGQALVTLRNRGPDTLFVEDYAVSLRDEGGAAPPAWPWAAPVRPGVPTLYKLAAGEVVSGTRLFQVPPLEQVGRHHYSLWADARFSRQAPDGLNGDGPDNLWLPFEMGAIPLKVTRPTAAQQLHARLAADRKGWRLSVTGPDGQPLPAAVPVWGDFEAGWRNGSMGGPLSAFADRPGGTQTGAPAGSGAGAPVNTWSGSWDEDLLRDGTPLELRVWVAAQGYVTTGVSATVPGVPRTGGSNGVYPTSTPALPAPPAPTATLAPVETATPVPPAPAAGASESRAPRR